jgi:hypothetical protein
MGGWQSYAFLWGPALTFLALGVLVLVLRWAYSPRRSTLVARRPSPGRPDEYGLLVSVAEPASFRDGERMRARLLAAGVHATLADTEAGLRLLVWPADEARARQLLRGG